MVAAKIYMYRMVAKYLAKIPLQMAAERKFRESIACKPSTPITFQRQVSELRAWVPPNGLCHYARAHGLEDACRRLILLVLPFAHRPMECIFLLRQPYIIHAPQVCRLDPELPRCKSANGIRRYTLSIPLPTHLQPKKDSPRRCPSHFMLGCKPFCAINLQASRGKSVEASKQLFQSKL